jgi:hypothetical protein
MPPDFLLTCTACGTEAVWDTEAVPPVGDPEVGHPVVWFCATCQAEMKHRIAGEVVITDKLHHDICVATELERATVDRVLEEVRRRHAGLEPSLAGRLANEAEVVDAIAEAAGVPAAVVREIVLAEQDWGHRRGYSGG